MPAILPSTLAVSSTWAAACSCGCYVASPTLSGSFCSSCCRPLCSVLDLGSGSGRDCYVAAALVGERGSVTGVDMTPAQLAVARKHAEQYCTQVRQRESGHLSGKRSAGKRTLAVACKHAPAPAASACMLLYTCLTKLPDWHSRHLRPCLVQSRGLQIT